MQISSDYKDLLKILNKHKVRYLIVGAYAVIFYTEPEIDNATRVYLALKEFGAPLKNITQKDFTNPNLIYQIGVAPIRVDIMMGVPGVKFESAWKYRSKTTFEKVRVNIIGIKELIKTKQNSKRDIDISDTKNLKKILKWT